MGKVIPDRRSWPYRRSILQTDVPCCHVLSALPKAIEAPRLLAKGAESKGRRNTTEHIREKKVSRDTATDGRHQQLRQYSTSSSFTACNSSSSLLLNNHHHRRRHLFLCIGSLLLALLLLHLLRFCTLQQPFSASSTATQQQPPPQKPPHPRPLPFPRHQ